MDSANIYRDYGYYVWIGQASLWAWTKYLEYQRSCSMQRNIQIGSEGLGTSNILVGEVQIVSTSGPSPSGPILLRERLIPSDRDHGLEYENDLDDWHHPEDHKDEEQKWTLGDASATNAKKKFHIRPNPHLLKPDPVILGSLAKSTVNYRIESVRSDAGKIQIGSRNRLVIDGTLLNGDTSKSGDGRFSPNGNVKINLRDLMNVPLVLSIDLEQAINYLSKMFSALLACGKDTSNPVGMQKHADYIQPEKVATFICAVRRADGKLWLDIRKPIVISDLPLPDFMARLADRIRGYRISAWKLLGMITLGVLIVRVVNHVGAKKQLRDFDKFLHSNRQNSPSDSEWKIFKFLKAVPQTLNSLTLKIRSRRERLPALEQANPGFDLAFIEVDEGKNWSFEFKLANDSELLSNPASK